MQFTMNGASFTYTTGTIALNTWHYVAVTVVQKSSGSSRACMKIDTVAQKCSTNFNSVFTESGTSKIRIGNGYNGFIN